jgi:acetyl esterase/lipase
VTPLVLEFTDPPIDLQGESALYARGVSYGPHAESLFDIFLADSPEPTPLVVHIHGGGFVAGGRGIVYTAFFRDIREVLSHGVSYATIDYRLLDEIDTDGVLKPLGDSKRCLQYLRYHHEELNIDPTRIALYGSSAGAGTCLWLATQDDMADPGAWDPVLRESTRVSAIGTMGAQATYDITKWETVVFESIGFTLEDMANLPNASEQGMMSFYGVSELADLADPEIVIYRQKVDMLSFLTADDPPMWMQSTIEEPGEPGDKSELMHHGLQTKAVLDIAEPLGIECQGYVEALEIEDPAGEDVVPFLLDHLGVE